MFLAHHNILMTHSGHSQVVLTWLYDDGDLGRVLLSCRVSHCQLEGVVSLLHGGQLQDGGPNALNNIRTQ